MESAGGGGKYWNYGLETFVANVVAHLAKKKKWEKKDRKAESECKKEQEKLTIAKRHIKRKGILPDAAHAPPRRPHTLATPIYP